MGTFGHNDSRDNWFYSDGALDNQAWDDAISVAATGRITQLTAYMAGDTGPMTGGPALWNGDGSLALYTAQSIARRSAPYSGGFDGTGRNANDGYYINVYGFNKTFTNPTSFFVGAFRNSGDSWILGNSDHVGNLGHLKTVGGGTPSTASGGNDWAHEAAGYNGLVEAYATYVPLGLYARVAGVFVPATLKRFYNSTTTYFDTIMGDAPIRYYLLDEASGTFLDYGSDGLDIPNILGVPERSQSALIVDADKACGFGPPYDQDGAWARPISMDISLMPKTITFEGWIKFNGPGGSAGGGNATNTVFEMMHYNSADRYQTALQVLGDGSGGNPYLLQGLITSWDFPGIPNNGTWILLGTTHLTTGTVYHVVMTYDAGPSYAGDGNAISLTGTLKLYLNGALEATDSTVGSIKPIIYNRTGFGTDMIMNIGTVYSDEHGSITSDETLDEIAMYNYVLTPAQIAHHYAVGTGSTGGTVSTAATLYVRNDANTAWIQLNMAALKQEMPERREFPVMEVWPDGRYRKLLGRWGDPETFGFDKRAMNATVRRPSGLIVPRQFATA